MADTAESLLQNAEVWPLADLEPNPDNARKHPQEQVDRLAASIQKFGFTMPILADENGLIIAGHGRYLAAKQAGVVDVPVLVAKDWSDEQKRAYALADNRLAEGAEWDMNKLVVALNDLAEEEEFDLHEIGFSEADLDAMTKGTFTPNLSPFRDDGEVTAADMDKAAKKQAQTGVNQSSQSLREVTCPHCGGEFSVDA